MENNFGLIITKTLRFYSEEERHFKQWFVDLPEYIEQGGTKEELQMVIGADMLLDRLSNHASSVVLKVSNVPFKGSSQLDLAKPEDIGEEFEDIGGAFYYVDTINDKFHGDHIWLCEVTKYVFNDNFPETIYYKVVQ